MYEIVSTLEESWVAPGDLYLLADDLAESTLTQARATNFKRVKDILPEDLENTQCFHPFSKLDDFWLQMRTFN